MQIRDLDDAEALAADLKINNFALWNRPEQVTRPMRIVQDQAAAFHTSEFFDAVESFDSRANRRPNTRSNIVEFEVPILGRFKDTDVEGAEEVGNFGVYFSNRTTNILIAVINQSGHQSGLFGDPNANDFRMIRFLPGLESSKPELFHVDDDEALTSVTASDPGLAIFVKDEWIEIDPGLGITFYGEVGARVFGGIAILHRVKVPAGVTNRVSGSVSSFGNETIYPEPEFVSTAVPMARVSEGIDDSFTDLTHQPV